MVKWRGGGSGGRETSRDSIDASRVQNACDIRAHHVARLYLVVTRYTNSHVVGGRREDSTLPPLCYPSPLRSIFPSFDRVLCVSFIDALLPYYIRQPSSVRGIRKHLTCSNFVGLSSASRAASDSLVAMKIRLAINPLTSQPTSSFGVP